MALPLATACVEMDGDAVDVSHEVYGLSNVTWQSGVGVNITGNDLTKTAPQTQWNAGAASVEILSSDGYVEFTTGETNTDKMAGLNSGTNSGVNYVEIDFAIFLKATGKVGVYENGVNKGSNFGNYVAGDVFRVEASGGTVTYQKNGVTFYTSANAPSFPLYMDASLRNVNATISNAVIETPTPPALFWTDVSNAQNTNNDLVKTAIQTSWNAGARSTDSFSGDGYVDFTTGESNRDKMAGASAGSSGVSYTEIDYAIYLKATGKVAVYENGVNKGSNFGNYVAGDVFRVLRTGSTIEYQKNGVTFYTSLVPSSGDLLLDCSLRTLNSTINDGAVVDLPDGP
jgi:hypothetical protein